VIPSTPLPSRWEDRAYQSVRRVRDRLAAPLLAGFGRLPAWSVSVAGVAAAASTLWMRDRAPAWTLVAFSVALLADALDGAVARRNGTASSRGKWIDHACDATTFLLLVLAAVTSGWVSPRIAGVAVFASLAVVAVALAGAHRRDPEAFREHPRAGFVAHLPKLPFYVAFPTTLLGGPNLVLPALVVATALAVLPLPWLVARAVRR
jgi:phosphatidylglycerophosphate synthase